MIGLLQCDHVSDQFRSIDGDYDDMFRRWMPGKWRVYDVARAQLPPDLAECDAYITTGSRASVYDDEPWIHAFADLVRKMHAAQTPFLGVCFGHQMIGHALGGRVARSERGWGVGVHTFRVSQTESWMQPPLPKFNVLMSCQDQVEELPRDAVVLGGNAHCPVGLFRVGSMLGLQGHPEFSVQFAGAVMKHRIDRIGTEKVNAAIGTLNRHTHSNELAAWAHAFLHPPALA